MLGNFPERLLQVFPEERNKPVPNGYYFSVVGESVFSEEMLSYVSVRIVSGPFLLSGTYKQVKPCSQILVVCSGVTL